MLSNIVNCLEARTNAASVGNSMLNLSVTSEPNADLKHMVTSYGSIKFLQTFPRFDLNLNFQSSKCTRHINNYVFFIVKNGVNITSIYDIVVQPKVLVLRVAA